MQTLLRELKEQPEGISIGTDRVRADTALLHQALHEETLEKRREAYGAHGCCSQRRSRRAMASRMSSGNALRYQ